MLLRDIVNDNIHPEIYYISLYVNNYVVTAVWERPFNTGRSG